MAPYDASEEVAPPFQTLYFSDEFMSKFQPLASANRRLKEDKNDKEAQKMYDEYFPMYKNYDWCSTWDGNKYDLVFYGVSGYTGYLMMEYLKRVSLKRNPEPFTFAFAGRTPSRVADLRDREFAGTQWENTPVLQMSYDDPYSVIDLVKSARCVINVAGPYMLTQGELMIDCCISMGVHYCDISGEIPWSRRITPLNTEKGHEIKCDFIGRDGYFETARIAVETAMTLVFDQPNLPFPGGVLTPAVACGEALARRLIHSGVKFSMGEWHGVEEFNPPPNP